MGIEDQRRVEDDLAFHGSPVDLLIIFQRILTGGKQKVPPRLIGSHHVQGAGLCIIQRQAIVVRQDRLDLRVLQQADLLSAHIASESS